jgi:hypothetical protein
MEPLRDERADVRSPVVPGMRVSTVIRRYPGAVGVFLKFGCPDMRSGFFSVMARIMRVRWAARIHRLPLADLLEQLNRAADSPAR